MLTLFKITHCATQKIFFDMRVGDAQSGEGLVRDFLQRGASKRKELQQLYKEDPDLDIEAIVTTRRDPVSRRIIEQAFVTEVERLIVNNVLPKDYLVTPSLQLLWREELYFGLNHILHLKEENKYVHIVPNHPPLIAKHKHTSSSLPYA